MTPRPTRPSEWGELGEHEQRIRVLEAEVGGVGVEEGDICCPFPLDGLKITPCSKLASESYEGSFSQFTGGQFFEMLDGESPDRFAIDPTCAGQTLYVRGFLKNLVNFPVVGNKLFYAQNASATHTSASGPILSVANPIQGALIPWTPVSNYLSTVDTDGIKIIIDLGAGYASATRTGDYLFQFAWFDSTSNQDAALADVSINPGTEFGQVAVWNGVSWAPLPNGTVGQVLTINAGGEPAWA